MIVVIGGEKGGSGKSCLAQNLAVYLILKGRDVLIVDADNQCTTTNWARRRNDNTNVTKINIVQAVGNINETLLDLSKKYDDIIVDVHGQDSNSLRTAMAVATHMLIPFRPKRRDLETLPTMENLVALAKSFNRGLSVKVVLTQCPTLPTQVKRILESKEVCSSFGFEVLNAITTYRNIYDDADEEGLTVLDTKADPKATTEINDIAFEFFGDIKS